MPLTTTGPTVQALRAHFVGVLSESGVMSMVWIAMLAHRLVRGLVRGGACACAGIGRGRRAESGVGGAQAQTVCAGRVGRFVLARVLARAVGVGRRDECLGRREVAALAGVVAAKANRAAQAVRVEAGAAQGEVGVEDL